MPPENHVFRISFRLHGKNYELITVGPEKGESLGDLSPDVEIVRVEDLGPRSEMDDAELERLLQETADWNEWSGRL
jgi:hypothetical protein